MFWVQGDNVSPDDWLVIFEDVAGGETSFHIGRRSSPWVHTAAEAFRNGLRMGQAQC